ncbi:MAG: IS1 family transposase [Pyrinomonadaceae bacterium]|nr:IS1 family transposase [Pyrinomonadaceae bacterium]
MCYEEVPCPSCASRHVKKNGTTANRKQKYRCLDCRRQFITSYTYQGCIKFVRDLVVPMTLNSSGIRDISRVLRVSTNTVLKTLRERAAMILEPRLPARIKNLEVDELWSFIGNKSAQCWLWYALNRATKRIAAYVLGRRTDKSCQELVEKLDSCTVESYYTDDWQSYGKTLDSERHHIGKDGTQGIERHNLNFRTHVKRLHRRTICFSKSTEMHAAVIKLYVNYLNAWQHKL